MLSLVSRGAAARLSVGANSVGKSPTHAARTSPAVISSWTKHLDVRRYVNPASLPNPTTSCRRRSDDPRASSQNSPRCVGRPPLPRACAGRHSHQKVARWGVRPPGWSHNCYVAITSSIINFVEITRNARAEKKLAQHSECTHRETPCILRQPSHSATRQASLTCTSALRLMPSRFSSPLC